MAVGHVSGTVFSSRVPGFILTPILKFKDRLKPAINPGLQRLPNLSPISVILRSKEGFTLIELLVVISIIGLLASVVLVSLNSARAKSRDVKRVADMNQMAKALELYFNEKNTYPTAAVAGILSGTTAPNMVKFINNYPTAPKPADGGCVDGIAKGQNNYFYESNSSGSVYTITFCMGNNPPANLHAGTSYMTPGGFR